MMNRSESFSFVLENGDLCNPASPDFSEDSGVFEHATTELLKRIARIGAVAERDARTEAVRRLMRRGVTK